MQIAFWITLTPWTRPSSSTDKREPSCITPPVTPQILYCSSFHSSVSFPIPLCSSFPFSFPPFPFSHRFSCCNINGEYVRHTRAFSIARAAFVTLLVTPSDLLAADGIIFLILYTLTTKLTRADKSLLEGNCRCGFYHVCEFFCCCCNALLRIYIDCSLYLSRQMLYWNNFWEICVCGDNVKLSVTIVGKIVTSISTIVYAFCI